MRIIKLILGILFAVTALAIGFVLYLHLADLSVYKSDIEAAVSDALGHELSIEGDVDIEFGGQLRMSAVDVSLANPEWSDDPVYIHAEKIQIAVNTWTLLNGPIEVDAVTLMGVTISLQETADGKANWHRPDDQIPVESADSPDDAPILHSLVVEDLLFSLEAPGTAAQIIDIGTLTMDRNNDGVMSVRLNGSHEVDSSSIPYSLSASVSLGIELIELDDLQATFGEGEFSGKLSVRTNQEKPLVTANIISPRIDLRFASSEGVEENEAVENALVFSDTPLDRSWLTTVDLNAQAVVNEIVFADDLLRDANINITLANGSLSVQPFEFKLGGGGFSGGLTLRPDEDKHILDLTAQLTDFRIGALAGEAQKTETLPPLNLHIELSGRGDSIHDIMSGSSGRVSGTQSTGQINLQAAGFLFSDFVTSVLRALNPLAETESLTTLECGIYELRIDEGIATIETLAIQTDKLNVVSSGNIDLATEALDLSLRVKTREGLGLSLGGVVNSFLKIGGTLKSPAVGIDAAGSVTTAGAAVVTGGLSVLAKGLWDRVSAEVNMCSDLLASAEENPAN